MHLIPLSCIIVGLISTGILIAQDFKDRMLSVWLVMILIFSGLIYGIYVVVFFHLPLSFIWEKILIGLSLGFFGLLLTKLYEYFGKSRPIGSGDLLLFVGVGLWLESTWLPQWAFGAGLLTVITAYMLNVKRIPFSFSILFVMWFLFTVDYFCFM